MTTATKLRAPAEPQALLLLPRLRIQNANAISSPLTWGFPAASAFTGFAHALQRRMQKDHELTFTGVGIVCHRFDAQVSTPAGKRTKTFNLTRNPVGKDGGAMAIVEEGRAHLEVSLLIGLRGEAIYTEALESLAHSAWAHVNGMRIAGGSVLPATAPLSKWRQPEVRRWQGSTDELRKESRKLASRLLPGFALVSREGMLAQHTQAMRKKDPQATELDALLDLSRLNIEPPSAEPTAVDAEDAQSDTDDEGAPTSAADQADAMDGTATHGWRIRRRDFPGWLVPIPVGYAAISPLYAPGEVKNVRDRSLPFRFVESVFSLGEWISPHRVGDLRNLLWQHQAEPDTGFYRVTTPIYAAQPQRPE